MRWLAVALFVVLWSSPALAAYTQVGTCCASNSDSAVSTLAVVVADTRIDSGNICIGYATWRDSATVTGSSFQSGNTTLSLAKRQQANGQTAELWYGVAAAGDAGGATFTLTTSGNAALQATVQCLSGGAAAVCVQDSNGANQAAATTHNGGSITGANADLVVLASSKSAGSVDTANASYTAISPPARQFGQWAAPTGSHVSDGAWTSDAAIDTTSAHAVLRDTMTGCGGGGGGSAGPSKFLLLGIGTQP